MIPKKYIKSRRCGRGIVIKKEEIPMAEGRCMKCKKNVEIKDAKEKVWKNGMKALEGKCGKCGTKVCRILGKA